MTINKILTENDGCKLISALNVSTYKTPNCKFPKGWKNRGAGTVFFDYKDNVLRRFYGNNFDTIPVSDFKAAIKHIWSL